MKLMMLRATQAFITHCCSVTSVWGPWLCTCISVWHSCWSS